MYMILPTISRLFFILFNNNILSPLRAVRQQCKQKNQLQIEHQPQQQYTTSVLQNHKTKPLQQRKRRQQQHQQQTQEQQWQYCHINCLKNNHNDHNSDNNNYNNDDYNDYKYNNSSSNYISNTDTYSGNVRGEIKAKPTIKAAALRKSPQHKEKNKNEIQISHSHSHSHSHLHSAHISQRRVQTISRNTNTFAVIVSDSATDLIANGLNATNMRHVLR